MSDPAARLQDALAHRYRIERELGTGGMATVYLAGDLRHDRPVALKVLRPELAATLGAARFLREVQLTAKLQHPHILPLFDSGTAAGQLWYTMPYAEGESLRVRLRRETQLPLEEALQIARQVLGALAYAHAHGVVHRDIKPENILLEGGEAVVADFGIAHAVTAAGGDQLTETGLAVGTPAYMSPEQAAGEHSLDGRTDIYALGCVLYEMLAGEPPFTGPTPQAMIAKRLAGPVPHLRTVRDVPAALEQAVTRALARSPADRFATATEFSAALAGSPIVGTTTAVIQPEPRALDWKILVPRWGSRGHRVAVYLGLAGLLGITGYLAFASIMDKRAGHEPSVSAGASTSAQPSAVTPKSIAVLPFVNMSAERENEYFSDGMTEELINALSKVEGLRVAARTSAFAFKGKDADVREVGDKLRVATVLAGSVRSAGTRLRVTAQLMDAKQGVQLWSEKYDREQADVFAIQDELSRAIVSALKLRLAGQEDHPLVSRPTRSLEAYNLYLQGRYSWNQRTDAALKQAVRYFDRAISKDSGYAQAYAGLADAYVLLPERGPTLPAEVYPKAEAAARRALQLDSTIAEAYTSLGYIQEVKERDWQRAEQSFRRAIELNPSYATAHHWYGEFLTLTGRPAEGLAELERALSLDPLSAQIRGQTGLQLYRMRRYDAAIARLRNTIELHPRYPQAHDWLGRTYLLKGMHADAVTEMETAASLAGRGSLELANLAYVYTATGRGEKALGIRAELEERSRHQYVSPLAFARIFTGLGEKDQAFAWLDRAVEAHDPNLLFGAFDPLWDAVRSDPRFIQALKRMRLEP